MRVVAIVIVVIVFDGVMLEDPVAVVVIATADTFVVLVDVIVTATLVVAEGVAAAD